MSRLDPRLRVLYLVLVAVGVFVLRRREAGVGLLALQVVAWLALSLGVRRLARQVAKLWGFALFVLVSYAVTSDGPDVDRWVVLQVGFPLRVNLGGLAVAGLMLARVVTVVLASQVVRAGDERAIAEGLRRLRVPQVFAASMDVVLALMGGGGGGGGGGGRGGGRGGGGGGGGRGGGGGGGGGQPTADGTPGFVASVRALARGDLALFTRPVDRHISRAEAHLERSGHPHGRDVAVIAGVSLAMLGIKALKVLPSIPFAPGHKLVLLTPLYLVATLKTRSRIGGTLTGLTMGTVAFLLGDGRYGIFEIVKHVVPGIVADLLLPHFVRDGHRPGAIVCTMLGGLMGMGRFTTIFTVTLLVQAAPAAWAILIPGFLVHTGFGLLSGLVSTPLLRKVEGPAREMHATPPHSERAHEP